MMHGCMPESPPIRRATPKQGMCLGTPGQACKHVLFAVCFGRQTMTADSAIILSVHADF